MQKSGYKSWCGPCTSLQKCCYKLSPPMWRKEMAAAVRNGTLHAIPGLKVPADFVPPPGCPAPAAADAATSAQAAAAPAAGIGAAVASASAACLSVSVAATQAGAGSAASGFDTELLEAELRVAATRGCDVAIGDQDGALNCGVPVDTSLASFMY